MSLCRHSLAIASRLLNPTTTLLASKESRYIKRWVAPTLKELKRRRDRADPEPLKPRSTYLEWNYEAEIFAFGKRLGEEFKKDLLKRALVQREYANLEEFKMREKGEQVSEIQHNGDLLEEGHNIILNYIKSYYSKSYPQEIVEAVTEYLTTDDMLAHVAKHMGLTDLILAKEYPLEQKTLADTFKAVIVALKESQNLERSQKFIEDFLIAQIQGKDVYEIWDPEKPFDYLVKLLQENGVEELEPRLCNQSASNTILANYQVGLYSNKKLLGIGWGENVNIAKETAALDAIQRIHSKQIVL